MAVEKSEAGVVHGGLAALMKTDERTGELAIVSNR